MDEPDSVLSNSEESDDENLSPKAIPIDMLLNELEKMGEANRE